MTKPQQPEGDRSAAIANPAQQIQAATRGAESWKAEQQQRYQDEVAAAVEQMGPSLANHSPQQLLESTCLWWSRWNRVATRNAAMEVELRNTHNTAETLRDELHRIAPATEKKKSDRAGASTPRNKHSAPSPKPPTAFLPAKSIPCRHAPPSTLYKLAWSR